MCFLTVTRVFVVLIRMVSDKCYHKGFFPSQRRGAIPNMTYRMLFVLATRLKEDRKSRILMLVSKGQSASQRKKMPK